ncbi:MAG: flagellar motor switch protein FliN [Actinomycetota bacterium]|nr:flagellar motor switch protein FliN [Actinomycetota bacterium]
MSDDAAEDATPADAADAGGDAREEAARDAYKQSAATAGVDATEGEGDAGPSVPVSEAAYPDLGAGSSGTVEPRDLRHLSDIELELSVELGRARVPLRHLLALGPGAIIELDRTVDEPAEILVNGTVVARGRIVTVGDDFGVRVDEIVTPGADE